MEKWLCRLPEDNKNEAHTIEASSPGEAASKYAEYCFWDRGGSEWMMDMRTTVLVRGGNYNPENENPWIIEIEVTPKFIATSE